MAARERFACAQDHGREGQQRCKLQCTHQKAPQHPEHRENESNDNQRFHSNAFLRHEPTMPTMVTRSAPTVRPTAELPRVCTYHG